MEMECIRLRGSLRAQLCDLEGNVVDERQVNNLLVTVGRSLGFGAIETVNQATAQTISYLAIGFHTVAPTTADTALGNEVTRLNIATFVTGGLTNNPPSWQAQVSFRYESGEHHLGGMWAYLTRSAGRHDDRPCNFHFFRKGNIQRS